MLSRWERNIKTVSFKYEEGQVIPETYSISGGEHMRDTNFHSRFSVSGIKFGTKYNPDQAVLNVLDEAKRYVKGDRAQMSLFPKEKKMNPISPAEEDLLKKMKTFKGKSMSRNQLISKVIGTLLEKKDRDSMLTACAEILYQVNIKDENGKEW